MPDPYGLAPPRARPPTPGSTHWAVDATPALTAHWAEYALEFPVRGDVNVVEAGRGSTRVGAAASPQAFGLETALTGFGWSAQCPLNSLPLCSAAMAVNPITPMARNMRKKTTAITRTGILHLCAHSGTDVP